MRRRLLDPPLGLDACPGAAWPSLDPPPSPAPVPPGSDGEGGRASWAGLHGKGVKVPEGLARPPGRGILVHQRGGGSPILSFRWGVPLIPTILPGEPPPEGTHQSDATLFSKKILPPCQAARGVIPNGGDLGRDNIRTRKTSYWESCDFSLFLKDLNVLKLESTADIKE